MNVDVIHICCKNHISIYSGQTDNRGVSKGGAGEAIAPPLFGRIEGAAGSGAAQRTKITEKVHKPLFGL